MTNYKAKQPHSLASSYCYVLQVDKYWLNQELIDSFENITVEKLQAFVDNEYFSHISIESLMMGNLTVQGWCLSKVNVFKLSECILKKIVSTLFINVYFYNF